MVYSFWDCCYLSHASLMQHNWNISYGYIFFFLFNELRNSLHYHESSVWLYVAGVINGTAPNPVRLAELCEQLGHVLGRPSWLPVPDFALKAVLGEGATVVWLLLWFTCFFSIYPLVWRTSLKCTVHHFL